MDQEKTGGLMDELISQLDENMSALILITDDQGVGISRCGDTKELAKALFYGMYVGNTMEKAELYDIVSTAVFNLVANESPFRNTFINKITDIINSCGKSYDCN